MKKVLIKNIMTRSFESVTPEDSLKKAALIMRRTNIDDLPVVDEHEKLIGVMTKTSLLDAVAAGKPGTTAVGNLYKKNVAIVPDTLPYEEAIEDIRMSDVGSTIVQDENEDLVGVVTISNWIAEMLKKDAFLSTQLNAILHTMHTGLLTIDTNKKVTSLNRAAENILKTSNADVSGKPLDDVLPGLDLNKVLVLGTDLIGIEYWQKELNLICNINAIISDNVITGAVIVIQDMTELIKKISELESITKLYGTLQSVMDIAYDGIIVVDEKSCISMVNKPAATFFRKNEKETLGKPVEGIIKNTRVREVVKTGTPELNQLQFISGTPYVVSILPIMRKGRVIGAVFKILFRHLTEVSELAKKLENADQQLAFYRDQSTSSNNEGFGFDQIVTADPGFTKIKEECEIVARGSSNILITGESGTGKELIAQAIHYASSKANGPLVKINCAAIPENLLESEFFGYAPGAFSGAHKQGRTGKLISAEGGTLFLDEIGDMSLNLQSKLLRVLQDRKFEPVGSNRTIEVNIRLITATNQNLEKLVEQGRFRSDLYYRLNVINFQLPPLRKRPHDINLLVHFFMEKYSRIFGASINEVSNNARQILLNHHWPGNVRELENVVERAINFAHGNIIESDDLPLYLKESNQDKVKKEKPLPSKRLLKDSREKIEKVEILAALEQAGGRKTEAARILGISRSWLYEKMSKIGIN